MKRLFDIANQFCKESTWKTIAALKFCLLSLGMIVGLLLPDSAKTPVIIVCAVVFIATYIPLMVKLYKVWKR